MCNSGAVGRPEVPPGWWRGSWSEPGVLGVRGQETGASAQAESRFVLALRAGWAVPTCPGEVSSPCLSLPIPTLFSPRDVLTASPGSHVLPAPWVPFQADT